jgi:hypothetical protein
VADSSSYVFELASSTGPWWYSGVQYMNYNNIFRTNIAYTAIYNGSTPPGFNSVSQVADPQYISREDLHIQNCFLAGKGISTYITDDIDGQIRLSPPTIGADECDYTLSHKPIENPVVNFNFYPNPANNILNIEGDQITGVKVYNMRGELMISKTLNAAYSNRMILDIQSLASGTYMLVVESSNYATHQPFVVIR